MTSGGLFETDFYNRTCDEALDLTVEARDYVADGHSVDRECAAFGERGYFDCEALRMTTRLSQVMAWLMVQRAVHKGKISIGDAREVVHQLGGQEVCFDNDLEIIELLPSCFRSLMARSLKLYQRIARFNEMVARNFD